MKGVFNVLDIHIDGISCLCADPTRLNIGDCRLLDLRAANGWSFGCNFGAAASVEIVVDKETRSVGLD